MLVGNHPFGDIRAGVRDATLATCRTLFLGIAKKSCSRLVYYQITRVLFAPPNPKSTRPRQMSLVVVKPLGASMLFSPFW